MSTGTETAVKLTPGAALGQQGDDSEWPSDPENLLLPLFDTGVFINELAKLDKIPPKTTELTKDEASKGAANPELLLDKANDDAPPPIKEGTWRGTQLALTKTYDLIETSYKSYMDTANIEPTFPPALTIEDKRKFYRFTDGSDFPPHLNLAPNKPVDKYLPANQQADLALTNIFDPGRLIQLSTLLPTVLPSIIKPFAPIVEGVVGLGGAIKYGTMGTPDVGEKLEDVEKFNATKRANKSDIFDLPNIGDVKDWYTDARFAQQHFTGTNPATIERADKTIPQYVKDSSEKSGTWIEYFSGASKDSADQKALETIKKLPKESLYVQDYSYFRYAAGIKDQAAVIKSGFSATEKNQDWAEKWGSAFKNLFGKEPPKPYRYGVSSVALFHLTDEGKLIPLAIVVDWRGSAAKSVTIYNRELFKRGTIFKTDQPGKALDEANDWPWRYAKTAVQTSDWLRHEVTVHLTNTHLVEEAVIVAANRSFETNHPVLRILYPHWQKTLSLNAAARTTLVPHVIVRLMGFEEAQGLSFIRNAYETFDYKGKYVPQDLKDRGFPPEKLKEPKYHNYVYAKCINDMWYKIRQYVEDMFSISFKDDAQVKGDKEIQAWVNEMRSDTGAKLKKFPEINTLNDLIDAVTMAIHIASPQHTSVNYLQNYYQSFVVNKPASLYAPPPETLEKLLAYKEKDLVNALPMNHSQDWLLSSHIPYLLSFKPGDKESLIIYAASKYQVYKAKTAPEEVKVKEAAARFYQRLANSKKEFSAYADQADDRDTINYQVLNPDWNAVSILI